MYYRIDALHMRRKWITTHFWTIRTSTLYRVCPAPSSKHVSTRAPEFGGMRAAKANSNRNYQAGAFVWSEFHYSMATSFLLRATPRREYRSEPTISLLNVQDGPLKQAYVVFQRSKRSTRIMDFTGANESCGQSQNVLFVERERY